MMESNELIAQVATEISNAIESRVTIVLDSMVHSLLREGVTEIDLENVLQTAYIELKMRKVDITVMDALAVELAARDARIKELEALLSGTQTNTERLETGLDRPAQNEKTYGKKNPPPLRLG